MSNFQKQKKQFEVSTEVFIDFLMTNGYLGKMKMHDAIEPQVQDRTAIFGVRYRP